MAGILRGYNDCREKGKIYSVRVGKKEVKSIKKDKKKTLKIRE